MINDGEKNFFMALAKPFCFREKMTKRKERRDEGPGITESQAA